MAFVIVWCASKTLTKHSFIELLGPLENVNLKMDLKNHFFDLFPDLLVIFQCVLLLLQYS